MIHSRINAMVFCLLAVHVRAACLLGAEVRGDLSLLELVANTWRANMDRMETWQGEVEVISRRRTSESGQLRSLESRALLSYVYDARKKRARWGIDYQQFKRSEGGSVDARLPEARRYLQKEGFLYEIFLPWQGGRLTAYRRSASTHRIDLGGSGEYSILSWLQGHPGATDEWAMGWFRDWRERDGQLAIERAGNELRVEHVSLDGRYRDEYTIDLAGGALLLGCRYLRELPDERLTSRAEISVTERNGVCVPDHVRFWEDWQLPQPLHIYYELKWRRNEVNVDIPEREFTLAALGLRPGDSVFDSHARVDSRYQGEPAPPPPRSLARDAPVAARRWWLHAAWIAPPAVALAVAAWLALCRRRKRARPAPPDV